MENKIKQIVIVGRDADAWLSAAMLQLHLRKQEIQVRVVELLSALSPEDFYAVLPTHKRFHAQLGLDDEPAVLKLSGGLPVLAQRYLNWSGEGTSFVLPYDTTGARIANIEFIQYWLKARSNGMQVAYEQFSVGAMAAQLGRYLISDEDFSPFSNADYGYHLDALSYVRAIKRVAVAAGVQVVNDEIASISIQNNQIKAIRLKSGVALVADLYIDASGAERVLSCSLENDAGYECWEDVFPCDRMIVGSASRVHPYPSLAQISAFSSGWVGLYPMIQRTGVRALYCSQYSSAESACESIQKATGFSVRDCVQSNVTYGIQRSPWIGNCVALGEAAINLDYLDSVQLHMLHKGIALLRSLFPVSGEEMPEAKIFNQRFYSHSQDVRDFTAIHYALNRRAGDPFWDVVRDKEVSVSAQEKLELFRACGQIPMREYQSFQEQSWSAMLLGHGIMPAAYNHLVNKVPDAELMSIFQGMLKRIASTVNAMPSMQMQAEMNLMANNNKQGR